MSEKAPQSKREKAAWVTAGSLSAVLLVGSSGLVAWEDSRSSQKISQPAEGSIDHPDAIQHKDRRATNPTWDACMDANNGEGCEDIPKYEKKPKIRRDNSI